MANIQHASITGSDLHEMKGADTAAVGTVPFASGTGTTPFRKIQWSDIVSTPSVGGYASVLSGYSTAANQVPSTTNTALQIEFGAGSATSDVSLASNGTITFLTAGYYLVSYHITVGTTATNSLVFWRWLQNGVQTDPSHFERLLLNETNDAYESVLISAAAGDTWALQFESESSGAGIGGLYQAVPSASGWATAPTAFVRVFKQQGLS